MSQKRYMLELLKKVVKLGYNQLIYLLSSIMVMLHVEFEFGSIAMEICKILW